MKLRVLTLVGVIASTTTEATKIRGTKNDNNEPEQQQEDIVVRGLKKEGGGGGGGGGGHTGGCPNFTHGNWPDIQGCCGPEDCSVGCCVNYPQLIALGHGYTGWCGDPAECNDYDTCMTTRNDPYMGCGVATPSSQAAAGDVIDIQTNDVDIQVFTNKDGNEVIHIASAPKEEEGRKPVVVDGYELSSLHVADDEKQDDVHHSHHVSSVKKNSPVVVDGYELASIHVASEDSPDETAADCEGTQIYVRLELLVDEEFKEYGELLLGDDDDDDTTWHETSWSSSDVGKTEFYTACVARDACHHFSIFGGDQKAFTWGYAKLNVDYRNGANRRLLCLGSTQGCQEHFKVERRVFGCDCDPANVANQNAYVGGCTEAELTRAEADDSDDSSGD